MEVNNMLKMRKINSWKERNIKRWEKIVSTYLSIKKHPSARLIFKLIQLILNQLLSIIIKKVFLNLFPNF